MVSDASLPTFLDWAIQNGIEGLGTPDSKVSMYETTSGDRGLLCILDVAPGDVLLTVPMRLAITDHADDEDSNALLYEGAPWSVRLATKLLRERAKGDLSPWWPYLQVLPRQFPTPSETFSADDMMALEYEPIQGAIQAYGELVADAFARCSADARGAASLADFAWAMGVVHSRTFGSAARAGGVGARMLVPLVDMLNHGGDEVQLEGGVLAADNVRWDLVPPAEDGSTKWSMSVKATSEIYQGEQVVLSYGERSNDDFLLHYGFVPPRNAHDEAVLFQDLDQALGWHYQQYNPQMPKAEAAALYTSALSAGEKEQQQEAQALRAAQAAAAAKADSAGAAAADGTAEAGPAAGGVADAAAAAPAGDETPSTSGSDDGGITVSQQLKLYRAGRVSGSLMVAFALASGGDNRKAEAAVTRRCTQLLQGMSRPLLPELALLARDAAAVEGLEHDAAYYTEMVQHYHTGLNRQRADVAAYAARPPPPSADGSAAAPTGPPAAVLAAAAALAAEAATPSRSPEELVADYSRGFAGPSVPLTPPQRLTTRYMADKKRLMWDLVLAAGPGPSSSPTSGPTSDSVGGAVV